MKLLSNPILPTLAVLIFSSTLLAQTPEADESRASKEQREVERTEETREQQMQLAGYQEAVEAARVEQQTALEL